MCVKQETEQGKQKSRQLSAISFLLYFCLAALASGKV
jgi:hypothetical protein